MAIFVLRGILMIRSILTTFVSIAILFGASILESNHISKTFESFHTFLSQSEIKLESENASVQDLEVLENFWLDKKRSLHIFIPHNDIKEIDLWIAECVAYAKAKNFPEAISKIKVLKLLAKQIPNTFLLKFENIF